MRSFDEETLDGLPEYFVGLPENWNAVYA